MRFPGNCLVVALVHCAAGGSLRSMRNRTGRMHFYWVDGRGLAHEFYTKGASRRGYLRNALTLGEVKRCPALDEPTENAHTAAES